MDHQHNFSSVTVNRLQADILIFVKTSRCKETVVQCHFRANAACSHSDSTFLTSSLGLVSPGAATDSVTSIFSSKTDTFLLITVTFLISLGGTPLEGVTRVSNPSDATDLTTVWLIPGVDCTHTHNHDFDYWRKRLLHKQIATVDVCRKNKVSLQVTMWLPVNRPMCGFWRI